MPRAAELIFIRSMGGYFTGTLKALAIFFSMILPAFVSSPRNRMEKLSLILTDRESPSVLILMVFSLEERVTSHLAGMRTKEFIASILMKADTL